jgi:hypothetical protein
MLPTIFNTSRKEVLVLGAGEQGDDTSNILSLVLLDKMAKERSSDVSDRRGRPLGQTQKTQVARRVCLGDKERAVIRRRVNQNLDRKNQYFYRL